MKRYFFIISFLLIIVLVSHFVSGVSAQTPTKSANPYNISFPIPELGNCTSMESCKTYCSNEVNRDVCVAFAKQKGFYKQVQNPNEQSFLEDAKKELGCDSKEACKAFCQDQSHKDVCIAFSKKHSLERNQNQQQEQSSASSSTIVEKAKTFLGCDSYVSCRAFCEQVANKEKCSQFARQLKGALPNKIMEESSASASVGERQKALYCREHPEQCKEMLRQTFQKKIFPSTTTTLPGQNNLGEGVKGAFTRPSFLQRLLNVLFGR